MQRDYDTGKKEDLALYRIETAKEDLKSAKALFDIPEYRGANNRAYYAIYHAITAIHALDEVAYKRHKGRGAGTDRDSGRIDFSDRKLL